MLLIGLIVFVTIIFGLGVLLNKSIDRTVGTGLGIENNEKWGMEDKEEYHK